MREDPFFPAVGAFIGEVAGQRICDLACGQGRVARHLADLGARRHEETEPRGIEYLQAERLAVGAAGVGLFDSVVCCMALMDILDLAPTLHSVGKLSILLLKLGAWLQRFEQSQHTLEDHV